jgi:hypothetical protein
MAFSSFSPFFLDDDRGLCFPISRFLMYDITKFPSTTTFSNETHTHTHKWGRIYGTGRHGPLMRKKEKTSYLLFHVHP